MRKSEKDKNTSKPVIPEKKRERKKTTGKTSSEIMHRQITNKDSVITDEEFNNIMLEKELPPPEEGNTPLDIPNDKERPKDENKDHGTITPWDVISE